VKNILKNTSITRYTGEYHPIAIYSYELWICYNKRLKPFQYKTQTATKKRFELQTAQAVPSQLNLTGFGMKAPPQ